jgi:replicative DNA helicase
VTDQAQTPPQNDEAEVGVLGTVLLSAAVLGDLSTVDRLDVDHFYRPRHQAVYAAMLALQDRGEAVDATTVAAELDRRGQLEQAGGQAYVHSLPTMVASAGSVRDYARIVREDANFRSVLAAARQMTEAAMRRDPDAIAAAESLLTAPGERDGARTKDGRREALFDHFENGGAHRWPWPFPDLQQMTGGIWHGQFGIVAGWSRHGKSVWLDQILERAHRDGARCGVYLTEMTDLERDLRLVARRTGLPLMRLMLGELKPDEHVRVLKSFNDLPLELIPAGGMTAREIGRDIRRRGWDVCGIDLLNAVTGRDVADIDENIAYLAGLATDTGTTIIGCQHLNRGRLVGAYPPEPAEGDIRGSGGIFNFSDFVMSVYLEERIASDGSPSGKPGSDAVINFLKVKNGIDGRLPAVFNGSRMRFELPALPGTVSGAIVG